MELRTIWGTILRRKWIIIQAFLVILISSALFSYLLTPTYKASSKILVKKSDSEQYLLSSIGERTSKLSVTSMKIEDHIELVTSRPVLERVIWKLQLLDGEGYLIEPDSFRNYTFFIYELFPKPCVQVEIVEQDSLETEISNQIEIVARATDPDEVAMIANTVAEEYVAENLRMKKEDYSSVRKYIERKIEGVKADYINCLENIRNFKRDNQTIDIEKETTLTLERLFELMKDKQDTIVNISEVQARIDKLKTQLDKESEEKVSSSTISENSYIGEIKNTIIDLELQLEEELTEKEISHPDVVILNNKLYKAREELKKEIGLIKVFSSEMQDLERDATALEAHLKSLDEEINKFMTEFYAIPEKSFRNDQLDLAYNVKYNLYNSLLDYLYDIIVAESSTVADIKIVEKSKAPDINKPNCPDMVLNTLVGIILGLIFGFGLGFLVEYLDDTIKGVKDIKAYGLTNIGSVPKINKNESILIFERDPKDKVSEFYRMISNSVKFSSLDNPYRTLLITSAVNGEGKSTVAVNLGTTFAREGKRVLIVDADFRNPMIDNLVGVSSSGGITDILEGNAHLQNVIRNIANIDRLGLLTAGSPPPDPSQMIESEKMKELISELTKQHEVVIFDSSPILISNDAISLSKYVDATILVLESGKISNNAFVRIVEHFKKANIPLAGVIINKFVQRRRGELL